MDNKIKKGTIVTGLNWPEPVEINIIEHLGDYIHIMGYTIKSREPVDNIIPYSEFHNLKIKGIESNFSEPSWKVFLALETLRYKNASLYDPLLAMNTSKVHPLPHQIEAVYGYVLKLPRIRFLIADDPGAGKTIMAGLIIKELKLRGIVKKTLIVVPGHLKDQWRRELMERFKETFVIIDRSVIDAHYGENVWQRESQIITSIDYAKREEVIPSLSSINFDLVIVDEAHKMSAYRYGDKLEKTSRYKLGETLSKITEHLLFLTATPHRGDPDNFRLFLDLLEPGFFSTNEMVEESIKNQDNPLFIRRVKEDLKDFDGKPIFLPRHVSTRSYNLGMQSPNEKELYNRLSEYVKNQYNKALLSNKKRNVAFALVILQRRFASSIYAVFKSLERRKNKLEKIYHESKERSEQSRTQNYNFDFEFLEDLTEEERWKEEEFWETISMAENQEELKIEISILEELILRARKIIENEEEIKLKELKVALNDLFNNKENISNIKILIFTESKDTLEYLEKKIKSWGYSANCIHGGMKLEERINAEKIFKNETQVLIATEAAGEGINLQFCNLMINYDIPWNPNRLEQRMGRIHRYGQTREVFIQNLIANDTREGKVLNKIFEKLEEIRKIFNSDKVFDVISEIFYNKSLSNLLIEAAAGARTSDEIISELDIKIDENYINRIKDHLGESLATRFIDYTKIKEIANRARENKLIPEYTEYFFKKAFIRLGGKIKERKDKFYSIDSIPQVLRAICDQDHFKRTYGGLLKKYPKITFDNEIAFKNPDSDFISFGHPLFESVLVWIEKEFMKSLINGALFYDPDGQLNGYILVYEGEIKDGLYKTAGKKIFLFYISEDKQVSTTSSTILWDLEESNENYSEQIDIESLKCFVRDKCITELEKYRQQLITDRNHQTLIKEKYGVNSLNELIYNLENDLFALYERKEQGDSVDLPIYNKEQRKEKYVNALKQLKEEISKEKSLSMVMPRFIGMIRVKPSPKNQIVLKNSKEIEMIGMKIAMEFESSNGRFPEDVSNENLGFDIKSKDLNGEYRYIEVKARAGTEPISLTQNEWFKAKRFKEQYFLYIILNANSNPNLFIIQNPSATINSEDLIEMVRYIVPVNEIIKKGEKHDVH